MGEDLAVLGLKLDTGQLVQAAADSRKALDRVAEGATSASDALNSTQKAATLTSKALDGAKKVATDGKKVLDEMARSADSVGTALNNAQKVNTNQLVQAAEESRKVLEEASKGLNSTGSQKLDNNQLVQAAEESQKALDGVTESANSTKETLEKGLKLDSRPLVDAANESSKALDQVAESSNRLGGSLQSVERLLKISAVAVAGYFSLSKASEFLTKSVALSSELEVLDNAFRKVGDTAGYSNSSMSQATRGVEKLGVSSNESRKFLLSLAQANVDWSNSSKLAAVAQDAAAISGGRTEESLTRLARGLQTQSTLMLRTMGLTVDWEHSYQQMANSLGKTVNQLSEAEKVQARVNAVLEAGSVIAGTYESSLETANGKLQKTWEDVDELETKIGQLFQPSYTKGVQAFGASVEFVSRNLENLLPLAAALVAIPIARQMASMGNSIALEAQRITAVLKGTAVTIDSAKATFQRAQADEAATVAAAAYTKSELAKAQAVTASTKATYVAAKAEQERLETERAAVAKRLGEARDSLGALPKDGASTAQLTAQVELENTIAGQRERLIVLDNQLAASKAKLTVATAAYSEAIGVENAALGLNALAANEVAAAEARVAEAQVAMSLSARVAAASMGALRGAMALVGGVPGLIFLGIVAVITKLATETSIATKVEREHGQALDEVREKTKEAREEFERLAKARGEKVPNQATSEVLELQQQVKEAQQALLSETSVKDYGFTAGGRSGELRKQLDALARSFNDGTMDAREMSLELIKLSKQYPEQYNWLVRVNKALEIAGAAQLDLTKAEDEDLRKTRELTEAKRAQASAIDSVTEKLLKDAQQARARREAFQTGGKQGLGAEERSQATEARAETAFSSYTRATGETYLVQLKYADALKMTNEQAREQAKQFVTKRADAKGYNEELENITENLINAHNKAREFAGLSLTVTNEDYANQQAQAAAERKRSIENIQIETRQTKELVAATKEGEEARRNATVAIAAERAARGLGTEATKQEKAEMEAATKALQEQQQVLQRTTSVQGIKQQLSDTQRLNEATKQGATEAANMSARIQVETALRNELHGATIEETAAFLELLAARQKLNFVQQSAQLEKQTENTRDMTQATLEGKEAVRDLTIQQQAQAATEGMLLTAEQRRIETANRANELRKQMAANDDLQAAQMLVAARQELTQLKAQGEAMRTGSEAAEEYAVTMAGVAAVNRLGADTSKELRDAIREVYEEMERVRQQTRKDEQAKERAEEPFKNLIRSMQENLGQFFDGILEKGTDVFTQLWDNVKRLFFRMISDMLAASIMNKLADQLGGLFGQKKAVEEGKAPAPTENEKRARVAGAGLAGFGMGYGIGYASPDSKAMGAVGGAAGGALTGFAVGGPVGAIVGGVAGFVGGLLGSSKAAEEAAKRMKEAQEKFGEALRAYADDASGLANSLGGSLRASQQKALDMWKLAGEAGFQVKEAVDSFKNLQDLAALGGDRQKAIKYLQDQGAPVRDDLVDQLVKMSTAAKRILDIQQQEQQRLVQDFIDGIRDKLASLQDDSQYEAQIRAIEREYKANKQNAEAIIDVTQRTEALKDVEKLHSEELKKAAEDEKKRQEQLALERDSFAKELEARKALADHQSVTADNIRFQIAQTQELAQATEKWAEKNPELIEQLKQVQRIEAEARQRELLESQANIKSQLELRAKAAEGVQHESDMAELLYQQHQEMVQAIRDWTDLNPELIDQLKQVQELELQNAKQKIADAKQAFSDDLRVRLLAAQDRDEEAAALRLQLQHAAELKAAIKEWGDSNPELIEQLRTIQGLEEQRQRDELADAVTNAPSGYKVERRVYEATQAIAVPQITTTSPTALPATTTQATSASQSIQLQFGAGSIPITIEAGDRPVDELVDEFITELRKRSLSQFGDTTHASNVLDS